MLPTFPSPNFKCKHVDVPKLSIGPIKKYNCISAVPAAEESIPVPVAEEKIEKVETEEEKEEEKAEESPEKVDEKEEDKSESETLVKKDDSEE